MDRKHYKITSLCAILLLIALLVSCGETDRSGEESSRYDGPNIVETGTLEAIRTKAFVIHRSLFQYSSDPRDFSSSR